MKLLHSHKTWPVFHRDAELISNSWKGTNLWDAQSTQRPSQPRRPLPCGVMASGCCHRDCFTCSCNAVPQHGGEATSPSEAVKGGWRWAVPYCKAWLAPSCISGAGTRHKGRRSERPVHLRSSPCCRAGLFGAENVAACPSSLSPHLLRGLGRAQRGADTAVLCWFLGWPPRGDPRAALPCRA